MTTTNKFQELITSKRYNAAAQMVACEMETAGESDFQEIVDYIEEGSFNGTETAADVARELDGLNNMVEGVDY